MPRSDHDVSLIGPGQRRQLETFQYIVHRLVGHQLHAGKREPIPRRQGLYRKNCRERLTLLVGGFLIGNVNFIRQNSPQRPRR